MRPHVLMLMFAVEKTSSISEACRAGTCQASEEHTPDGQSWPGPNPSLLLVKPSFLSAEPFTSIGQAPRFYLAGLAG